MLTDSMDINSIDDAGKRITDFIDFKIRLPALNFVDSLGKPFAGMGRLQMPELPRITFPDLPSFAIQFPDSGMFSSWMDNIKGIIGTFPDGATGVAGRGIFGFIGSVAKVLEPVLRPLRFVMTTVLRPFTQIILSVIDFVVGFYEGFTDEEGALSDKVLAGLEGGFLGVIKGITEAFDLLFITIPAWLLEKLGMDNAAEFLRGFSLTDLVDPIWAGIKGLTTFVGSNFLLMKDIIVGAFEIEIMRINVGVKNYVLID